MVQYNCVTLWQKDQEIDHFKSKELKEANTIT